MKFNKYFSKLDFTLILSLVIGISYFFTYVYQAVYFFYFDIPFFFLSVGVKDVVFTMTVIFFLILLMYLFTMVIVFCTNFKIKGKRILKFLNINKIRSKREELNSLETEFNEIKKEISEDDKQLDEIDRKTEEALKKNESIRKDETVNDEIKKTNKENENYSKDIKNRIFSLRQDRYLNQELVSGLELKLDSVYKELRISYLMQIIILMFIFSFSLLVGYFITIDYFYWAFIIYLISIPVFLLVNYLFSKTKVLLLSIFMLIFFVFYVGVMSFIISSETKNFVTFEKDEKDYIVLDLYKDQFLYVNLNKKTNSIGNKYNLILVSEVDNFKKERIE